MLNAKKKKFLKILLSLFTILRIFWYAYFTMNVLTKINNLYKVTPSQFYPNNKSHLMETLINSKPTIDFVYLISRDINFGS